MAYVASVEALKRSWNVCKFGGIPEGDNLQIIYYIPTLYDDSYAPKGRYSCTLYLVHFPTLAPREEHERLKEEMIDKAIAQFTKCAPNFKSTIVDKMVLRS